MAVKYLMLAVLTCMVFAVSVNCANAKMMDAQRRYPRAEKIEAPLYPCEGREFNCEVLPSNPPTSGIRRLFIASRDEKPGEACRWRGYVLQASVLYVQLIGAMGDSITAAFGARAMYFLFGGLEEYGEVSWSIGGGEGGKEDVTTCATLPNIIRRYNPNLQGFAIGSEDGERHLNVAVSGSKAENMLEQAELLVAKIKHNSSMDVADWKVITMWIGGNDLCDVCNESLGDHSAEAYVSRIKVALEYLQQELPRTFVNVGQIADVSMMRELSLWPDAPATCNIVHTGFCSCIVTDPEVVTEYTERYQIALAALVNGWEYDENFTVVLQPFLANASMAYVNDTDEPDFSYFAPDCFHFSVKGHSMGATGLWNNMLEPVGLKTREWSWQSTLDCPENPIFYTKYSQVHVSNKDN